LQALAVALVLATAACGGQPPALPQLDRNAVVLAFGDSLTHGTGAKRAKSYPAVLADLIDRRVINAGVPGETTAEGRQRLEDALARHRPDLVLLCLGGNDFLQRKPDERTRANLAAMIETLRARDIPTVLLAVPEAKLLGGPHPMYAELAERYEIPLVRDAIADVLDERELKSDTIHPNAQGYRRIAEAVAQKLRVAGAI